MPKRKVCNFTVPADSFTRNSKGVSYECLAVYSKACSTGLGFKVNSLCLQTVYFFQVFFLAVFVNCCGTDLSKCPLFRRVQQSWFSCSLARGRLKSSFGLHAGKPQAAMLLHFTVENG